jgi:hypothetical protein
LADLIEKTPKVRLRLSASFRQDDTAGDGRKVASAGESTARAIHAEDEGHRPDQQSGVDADRKLHGHLASVGARRAKMTKENTYGTWTNEFAE